MSTLLLSLISNASKILVSASCTLPERGFTGHSSRTTFSKSARLRVPCFSCTRNSFTMVNGSTRYSCVLVSRSLYASTSAGDSTRYRPSSAHSGNCSSGSSPEAAAPLAASAAGLSSSSSSSSTSAKGHLPRSSSSSHGTMRKPPWLYHSPNSSKEMLLRGPSPASASSANTVCAMDTVASSMMVYSVSTPSLSDATERENSTVRKERRKRHSWRRVMRPSWFVSSSRNARLSLSL